MATLSQLINAKASPSSRSAPPLPQAAVISQRARLHIADVSHDALATGAAARSRRRSPGAVRGLVPIIDAACADLGATFCPHGQAQRMTVDDLMTRGEIDSPPTRRWAFHSLTPRRGP